MPLNTDLDSWHKPYHSSNQSIDSAKTSGNGNFGWLAGRNRCACAPIIELMRKDETAIIIGAGPAGLTAALELCRRSSIKPIVLESTDRIGGISCTIRYNGNRIDIGGHRFFSKSDRVLNWWAEIMPIEDSGTEGDFEIRYQNQSQSIRKPHRSAAQSHDPDCVMLVRPRKSRIYFLRSFFDYPLSFSVATLRRLGFVRTVRILASYLKAQLFQRKPEKTLEDFLVNRFGNELYRTFFKSYTEKVWGVQCSEMSAAWGAQRIKGVSLRTAASHFIRQMVSQTNKSASDIRQSGSETSLIQRFLYPKFGPGQLWERVAELIADGGGEVRLGWRVVEINVRTGDDGVDRVISVVALDPSGQKIEIPGDYFVSTMPIRSLIRAMRAQVPAEILEISEGLVYRDFITVGLLADKLLITEPDGTPIKDTWIYIQEPEVLVGRIQFFNNWSPHLVSDPSKMWIGLEYFCYDTDAIWKMTDAELKEFAIREIAGIGIIRAGDICDAYVIRVPKAYPAYFRTYNRFDEIVSYVDRFENLFLIGRNGMHRYNNQDHSMLTAMVAVDNIVAGITAKSNLWEVNTEQEYHEQEPAHSEQRK
jgi:protoporphyrinogen oxidase